MLHYNSLYVKIRVFIRVEPSLNYLGFLVTQFENSHGKRNEEGVCLLYKSKDVPKAETCSFLGMTVLDAITPSFSSCKSKYL